MNTGKYRELMVLLLLAASLVLTACGTLQIDTEPAEAQDEGAGALSNSEPDRPDIAGTTATSAQEEASDVVAESGGPAKVADGAVTPPPEPTPATPAASSAALQLYENADYGFSLSYPGSWTLTEVNGEEFAGPGSRSVQLSQGTVTLVIGYRRAGEQAAIGGSGAPAGDFESRGVVQIVGQDVERTVIVYEGKDKAVMYGQPGMPISAGGLEIVPRLDDFSPNYDAVDLPQALQEEADMVLGRLTIDGEQGASAAADYSDWRAYSNEDLGYSLMYPGQADVMGADRDKSVEFVGPIVDQEHWPWLTVEHLDSGYFRPPIGADVGQWLAENDVLREPVAETLRIGGLPAVHYAFEASPQAYGRDEYYVINGDQLFKITLLHAGGQQDWTLYEQFLTSITFAEPN